MSYFRLDPPIPLLVDGREGLAHLIENLGIESEDLWVVFFDDGIRWVPNSRVRPCGNWTLGRGEANAPTTMYKGNPLCSYCNHTYDGPCLFEECPHK